MLELGFALPETAILPDDLTAYDLEQSNAIWISTQETKSKIIFRLI